MMRLSRKLLVLKAESVAVTEETAVNEALGNAVCERVERVARPHEVSRFKLHVKEVGHITSLLLSLSGRLARAENGLLVLPSEHPDRVCIVHSFKYSKIIIYIFLNITVIIIFEIIYYISQLDILTKSTQIIFMFLSIFLYSYQSETLLCNESITYLATLR